MIKGVCVDIDVFCKELNRVVKSRVLYDGFKDISEKENLEFLGFPIDVQNRALDFTPHGVFRKIFGLVSDISKKDFLDMEKLLKDLETPDDDDSGSLLN